MKRSLHLTGWILALLSGLWAQDAQASPQVNASLLRARTLALPGQQASAVHLLSWGQAEVDLNPASPSPPPLLQTPESASQQGLPHPSTLSTGIPSMVLGGILMAGGVNALLWGVLALLTSYNATTAGSTVAGEVTNLGLVLSLGGAALLGTGAFIFFKGRAQRALYNRSVEAYEGLSFGVDPRTGSLALAYSARF